MPAGFLAALTHNLTHLGATALACTALLALLHLQERAVSRYVAHRLGWRAVLLTGWLGVPLHELSHLVTAKLFGHRVVAFKLFDPDPVSGTLGYVRHAYARRSAWQIAGTFFVAVAPVAAGALALGALLAWMIPPGDRSGFGWAVTRTAATPEAFLLELGAAACTAGEAIWRHRTLWLPLQVYLCVAVACHMAPSRSDFAGAWPGLLVLALLLAGGAALAALRGVSLGGGEQLVALLIIVHLATGAFLSLFALGVGLWARARGGPALDGAPDLR